MLSFDTGRLNTAIAVVFWGVFALLALLFAARPIADPDFWWHLKTGEEMLRTGGLLQTDPFTYTTGAAAQSPRGEIILHGYWLWQLLAGWGYAELGLTGIVFLKALTVGAMYAVVIWRMHRLKIEPAVIMLFSVVSLMIFTTLFYPERPQVFSFLFAAALLGLFEQARRNGRGSWWLIPLMLVWACSHGAVFVGMILLAMFACGMAWEWRKEPAKVRRLATWAAAGIAVTFLQPTTIQVFSEVFRFTTGSALLENISEYQSTFFYFRQGDPVITLLWGLVLLQAFGMLACRERNVASWLIFVFLAYSSVFYLRNVSFYAVAMLPASAFYVNRFFRNNRALRTAAKVLALGAMLCLLWSEIGRVRENQNAISSYYPAKLADFLLASGVQGNMLNEHNWGGYLIWRLYPQHKVFIDGRVINERIYDDYRKINSASLVSIDGREEYLTLLDQYHIDYIVQPNAQMVGTLTPLLKYALRQKNWVPIYLDENGYILLRDSDDNRALLVRYGIDKRVFLMKMLEVFNRQVATSPAIAKMYVQRGDLLSFMGRYEESEKDLLTAQKLNPAHPMVGKLLKHNEILRRGDPGREK